MTSVASLIEVDLASASSKYNNPTKNVLSGPYLAETRGAKMPSGANWIDNTDTTYPSIQNRSGNPRGTISDNDYLNGSRFNSYPSQWREGLVRIMTRSLDNQEQQVLGLVLQQLGDTTGATLITNRLAATGASGPGGPVAGPANPTIGAITPGNTTARINFLPPSIALGGAATSYRYVVNLGATEVTSGTVTSSPILLSALTNGERYTITIYSVNSGGESVGVTSSLFMPTAAAVPVTIPANPTIGTITVGDRTASVPYTASSGATSHTYTVRNSATSAVIGTADQTASATPILLSGLTNGTSYTITIKAANSAGSSSGTLSSVFTPVAPVTAPTAVTIGTITPGNAQAIVPYTGGGAAGVTYKYTVYVGATTTTVSGKVDVTITGSPFTITGLNNGTAYTVIIKATNTGGSTDSARSSSFTPATVPGAPIITNITAIDGTGTATVAFTAPTSTGGAAITNYNYSINGATPVTLSPADTASPLTISSLVPGTPYSVIIRAINSEGAGAPSIASPITPQLYRFHATGFTLKTSALLRNGSATGAGTTFTFNETLAPANTYQVYYDTSITTSSAMSALKTNGMTATQLNYLFIKTPTSIYYLSAKSEAPNLDAIILFKRGSTTGNWNSGALDTTIYYTTNLTMGTRTVNTGTAMTTNRADFKPTFTPRITVLGPSDVLKARAPPALASRNYIGDYGGGGKTAPHIKTRSNRKKFTNTRKNK